MGLDQTINQPELYAQKTNLFQSQLLVKTFDGYDDNHVADGSNVLICIEGYCIDGLKPKVSFFIMSANEEIFKKFSQERKLSSGSQMELLPEHYATGSNLPNLIFNVTDLDGSADTSTLMMNNRVVSTLCIEYDANSGASSIIYAFVYEFSKISFLYLLENECVVSTLGLSVVISVFY